MLPTSFPASRGVRSQASIDAENIASSAASSPAPVVSQTRAPLIKMPLSSGHPPRLLGPAHEDHVVLLEDDLLLKSSFKSSGDCDIKWSRLSKPNKTLNKGWWQRFSLFQKSSFFYFFLLSILLYH